MGILLAVDNGLPRGGDIYMQKIKMVLSASELRAKNEESYKKMQRWYRIQQFAREVHKTLPSDEAVELFIQHMRHDLAKGIMPPEEIV